jgi:toxin CcdB
MVQFDVHRNPKRGAFPLLLDVQADLLSSLATRVVVPMTKLDPRGPKPISRLNPIAAVDGVKYALVFQELAAIPKSALGERVASLAGRRVDLIAALDLLLTGV